MKYGLQNIYTLQIVGFVAANNFGDKSIPQQHTLSENSKQMWLVNDPALANAVLHQGNTPWYLADYNNPTHNLNPNDFHVVSVEVVTQVVQLESMVGVRK